MSANPDLIVLKYSSGDIEEIESSISSTGDFPITDGELVISQESDRAYLYTIGSTGQVVRVYTGANEATNSNWNISEDGGDFDSGSASYQQYFLPEVLQPFDITHVTPELDPGEFYNYSIATGRYSTLFQVTSSSPVWLRLYGSALARNLDERPYPGGTFPPLGQEFWGEFVTTPTTGTIKLAPVVTMASSDGFARIKLRNLSASPQICTVTLTVVSIVN